MGENKTLREKFLRLLGKKYNIDLHGDLECFSPRDENIKISCVINFFGRLDLLAGILNCLVEQNYPIKHFEVILIEDQQGTAEGRAFCESFSDRLQIVYYPLDKNFGHMGYSRNYGLSKARGEFVLFLDDDTVILQTDFLSRLVAGFEAKENADAIIPQGFASYSLWPERYAYHEPYFMTSRCTAYRRSLLQSLRGFFSQIIGQEDVEFAVRFMIAEKIALRLSDLTYYHPPLLYPKLDKPKAVGYSFTTLRHRYPCLLFILLLLNCVRHLPLYFWPTRSAKEKGRFAVGFAVGIGLGLLGREGGAYQ